MHAARFLFTDHNTIVMGIELKTFIFVFGEKRERREESRLIRSERVSWLKHKSRPGKV